MTEEQSIKAAKSDPEDVQKVWSFLEKLGELVDEDDTGAILKLINQDFMKDVDPHYQRILFGYNVLVENACDPGKTYLEWKPEIKERIDGYDELRRQLEQAQAVISRISSLVSERHGDDDRFERPEDEESDLPETITIKRIFAILDGEGEHEQDSFRFHHRLPGILPVATGSL